MDDSRRDPNGRISEIANSTLSEQKSSGNFRFAEGEGNPTVEAELERVKYAARTARDTEISDASAALRRSLEHWAQRNPNRATQHARPSVASHAGSAATDHPVAGNGTADNATRRYSWSVRLTSRLAMAAVGLCLVVVGLTQAHRFSAFAPQNTGLSSIYTTPNGQQASVSLPDGSYVTLNVGSRLEVPSQFGAGNRQVRLSGEALFTVTHRDGTPFTVIAGASTTRVLGTTFAVRAYPTDTAVSVAVRDGRVSVQSSVINAHQEATLGSNGEVVVTPVTASRFGFVDQVLTLDNVALRDAAIELGRWYDADVLIGDTTLWKQRIGGEFTSGSRAEFVTLLQTVLGFDVVIDGRRITLYRR